MLCAFTFSSVTEAIHVLLAYCVLNHVTDMTKGKTSAREPDQNKFKKETEREHITETMGIAGRSR